MTKFCTGSVLATATFPSAGEGPGSHTMEKQRDGRLPHGESHKGILAEPQPEPDKTEITKRGKRKWRAD